MGGRDKLLELVEGQPLLRLLCERASGSGWPVIVTLPPGAEARRAALMGLPVEMLDVPDAASGMAASFRVLSAHEGPLLIALADMPEIEGQDFRRLIAAHQDAPEAVHRAASADGVPGQPVLFPTRLVPRMAGLDGDDGAKPLLRGEDVRLHRLDGRRALIDLDTPEEWSAWRAGRL